MKIAQISAVLRSAAGEQCDAILKVTIDLKFNLARIAGFNALLRQYPMAPARAAF
jgi:hypothetical protein